MFVFDGFVTPEGYILCEMCIGDAESESEHLYGESDCPEHCSLCGRPVDHELTAHGARLILEAIEQQISALLKQTKRQRQAPGQWPRTNYYHGSPAYAVVLDWAERLDGWKLSPWDRERIEFFRGLCTPSERRGKVHGS